MKTKRINFRSISKSLTDKELKNVLGGSSGGSNIVVAYTCIDDLDPPNYYSHYGYCAGPDCTTCMGYDPPGHDHNGLYCWNVFCFYE